jgi:hypothetical protein
VTLMLLSMILIPAYVLLAALFPANDRLVESAVSDTPFEKISQTILVTMFLAGLVRTAYAWFFQESAPRSLPQLVSTLELPLDHSRPRDGFGAWRARTGELVESRDSGETVGGISVSSSEFAVYGMPSSSFFRKYNVWPILISRSSPKI